MERILTEAHNPGNARRAAARLAPALVVAATVACFAPVLGNDFVDWDDYEALRDNPHYRGLGPSQIAWMFTTFRLGHYQPLSWLTLGADYLVWGTNAAGYHLTSALLHAAAALACFLLIDAVLRRVGTAAAAAPRRWAAAAGALFFALHPLRVEPVAWAAIRGDVLAGLLVLLAAGIYVRRGRSSPAALGLFAVSLLAKSTGVALPAVLVVIDHFALGRFRREGAAAVLREKLPWLALSLLALGVAFVAKNSAGAVVSGGAIPHGVVERVLQAAYGLCFYLARTLVPTGLSPLHPLERALVAPAPIFTACLVAVVVGTALLVALRRRLPGLLGAWLAYALAVSPVLGFAQSGPQLVADRYSYLASVPWSVLLAAGLCRAQARLPAGSAAARALPVAVAALLLLLGGLAARQTLFWRDSASLWDRALAVHPDSGLVNFYRANVARSAGELDAAVAGYTRALALDVPLRAQALNNRGVARAARGELDAALADISEAIRLRPEAAWYLNRGSVRVRSDPAAAIADWTEALRRDPDLLEARYARAAAREATGQIAGAIADYRAVLERAGPDWPERAQVARRLAALEARSRAGR
jgi:tetratricopeptide (TPR) repeat protein